MPRFVLRVVGVAAAGAAPVLDACGVAGGHRPPDGAFGGIYVNTSHAKLGDVGSKVLPVMPSGTTWAAVSGATVGLLCASAATLTADRCC